MRRGRIAIAGLAAAGGAAALLVAGPSSEAERAAAGAWRPVPAAPLDARESALALWTGSEVLVVGGSDTEPCPPNASCVPVRKAPLPDGAAYDPVQRTWRRIARAPAGFEFATGTVVGRRAYVLGDNSPARRGPARVFLKYRIASDRWRRLPPPARDRRVSYRLVPGGSRVVAVGGGHGHEPLLELRGRRWHALPRDGLGRSNGRSAAWSGEQLVSFACGPSDGNTPCIARAAAFDFNSGTWRRLPDSNIDVLVSVWFPAGGGRLVNPIPGERDGRPQGGVLDVASGTWSELPEHPTGNHWEAAGVLTEDGGEVIAAQGYVLDAPASAWLRIPALPEAQSRTVVAAGRDLFVFGGARFVGMQGRLLDGARIWTPE